MPDYSNHHRLAGRIGGLTRAARGTNEEHRKSRAKAGFMARFYAQVPAHITDDVERARRADLLMRAHMAGISKRSADTRRKPRSAAA
jgi:hypothetical protein